MFGPQYCILPRNHAALKLYVSMTLGMSGFFAFWELSIILSIQKFRKKRKNSFEGSKAFLMADKFV